MALTIAGSDSGGGAGIQADMKTFQAYGVWGTSAVTAVTAQNTVGVHDATILSARLVRAQIRAVAEDLGVDAAKTGMLGNAEVIRCVVDAVRDHGITPLVVDPVLVTSHGEILLEEGALAVLRDELFPAAAIITPNTAEAAALTDMRVDTPDAMVEAAGLLAGFGPGAVLIKGGHLGGDRSPDLLWTSGDIRWLEGRRLDSRHTHGTGCTLSAAICAQLATGVDLTTACLRGKEFVTRAIEAGMEVGHGVGPVNPGWRRS